MKRLIYIIIACMFCFMVQAQDTTKVSSEEEQTYIHPFFPAPEFPGGQKALFQYMQKTHVILHHLIQILQVLSSASS